MPPLQLGKKYKYFFQVKKEEKNAPNDNHIYVRFLRKPIRDIPKIFTKSEKIF